MQIRAKPNTRFDMHYLSFPGDRKVCICSDLHRSKVGFRRDLFCYVVNTSCQIFLHGFVVAGRNCRSIESLFYIINVHIAFINSNAINL